MKRIDPWMQIVSGLHERAPYAAQPDSMPVAQRSRKRRHAMTGAMTGTIARAMANASSIRRIEWQTTCTILVTWSDSTLGHYEDQTWREGFARTPGICGLTGVPVRRGDPVFRPLHRGSALPANALDMILADPLRAKRYSLN
jgi:hypothetical protein